MAMQKCLYCNTGTLLHVKPSSDFYDMSYEKEGISSLPLDLYQCDTCGIQCTKLEVDKAGSNGRSPFSAALQPETSEEELLVQAWNLMRKSDWEEALTVLFRAGSPLEHPLDFLICRDICQIAPLLLGSRYDLENRYTKLKMLLNDLSRLVYFITDDGDSDTTFNTLNRLYAALMLLGTLPVKRHVIYTFGAPAYYTNRYRAAALCAYADYLEAIAFSQEKHGTQYLKMAVQLCHRSLEACKEKEQLLPHRILYLNLPPNDRRQINAKISKLNAEIKLRDPQFNPVPPPPEPKVIPQAADRILSLIFWICVYVTVVSLISAFMINPTHSEQDARDFMLLNGMLLLLGAIFPVFFFSRQPDEIILPNDQGNMTLPAAQTDGPVDPLSHPANPPLAPSRASLANPSGAEKAATAQDAVSLKAKAGQQECLYCGSGMKIVRGKTDKTDGYTTGTDKNGSIIIAADYYKCPVCGFCISREEAGLAAKGHRTAPKSGALQSDDAETGILQSAWESMQQNQWDQALKVLFRQSRPFKHPLEFMVYRNICLAARLFVYPRTKWQAALLSFRKYDFIILKKRYDVLDPFIKAMRHLDYYLPQHDREETFRILSSIYRALSFFAGLTFKHYSKIKTHREHPYTINDYTHAKRITLVNGFAEFLQSKAGEDPQHEAEYLDMARKLLNQCLTLSLRINGKTHSLSLEAYSNKQSYIYEDTRVQIEKQIELLNTLLSRRDPRCLPVTPPGKAAEAPDLESTAPPTSCLHMIISGLFGLVIIPFFCFWLGTEITGDSTLGGHCLFLAIALYTSYLSIRSNYKMLQR